MRLLRTFSWKTCAWALLAISLTVGGLNACFKVDQPTCSFLCGPNSACPDDYECRSDGYCHLQGSTESCEFSDAAITADLSTPDLTQADMTQNSDALDTDAASDL